jgi:FtsP/CotA-like multicopper oxidase with cupredoxin domain
LAGVFKDAINVPRYQNADVDFVADDPVLTLFHWHMQHLSCSGMTNQSAATAKQQKQDQDQ